MIHITTHTETDVIYWIVAQNGNVTLSRKAIRLASGCPIRSEEHLISDLCEEVLRLQQELARPHPLDRVEVGPLQWRRLPLKGAKT